MVHFFFGYTLLETLVFLLCFCIIAYVGFLSVSNVLAAKYSLMKDLEALVDELFLVDFVVQEYKYKHAKDPAVFFSKNYFNFRADYNGKTGRIMYQIVEDKGITKVVRIGLSGEGNNVLIETKKKLSFVRTGNTISLTVGDLVFDICVLK